MSFWDRFSRKAQSASQMQAMIQLITSSTATKTYSAQELVAMNKSWVYLANNKVASTCATTPFYLYYASKDKPKYVQTRAVGKDTAKAVKKVFERSGRKAVGDVVEVLDHPLLNLMAGSDTQPGWEDMTKNSIEYLGLIGNAYWKIELDANGLPARLLPLQAEAMQVAVNKEGMPVQYIYQPTLQGGNAQVEQVKYTPAQIVHFLNRSPGNTLYSLGKGKLEACIDAATLYQFMDNYEQYLNRNMARPDVVVSYKGAPSEAEMKAVMAMWNKAFRGEQNSGKPLVTSGDVDVKNLGFAPRDMQFQIGRQWAKKVILATYGVPEALVEINDANYASSYSAMSHFTEYTIHPELAAYLAVFNRRVTRLYDPNLVLWYDEQVASDPQTQSAIVNTSFVNGIISRGEAREALGYGAEADDSANLEQSQGQTGAQA